MRKVLFLFVSTLAMACAQQHEKSAIQAALDANNFELAAQLAAQAAARGRRGNVSGKKRKRCLPFFFDLPMLMKTSPPPCVMFDVRPGVFTRPFSPLGSLASWH